MNLAHKGIGVFATNWLVFPLNLLTGVLVIRTIGAEGQGILALLMAAVAMVALLGNLGTPAVAIYYLRKGIYNPRALIVNFMVLTAFFSLLVWGLLFLYGEWFIQLFFKGVTISPWLILLAFSSLPVMMLSGFISNMLLGAGLSKHYARLTLGTAFIDIVATLLFVVVLPFGVTGAVVAKILAATVALLAALRQIIKSTHGCEWQVSWGGLLAMVRLGSGHYVGSVSSLMFKKGGNFLLAYFLNVGAVGYYSVAVAMYDVVLSIPRAVATLVAGEAASREGTDSASLVSKSSRNVLWAMVLVAILLAIISPWLIPVLLGADFIQSVVPIIILLPAAILIGLFSTIHAYFLGIGRPGIDGICVLIATVVSLSLSVVLIPIAGIIGMALATLLGSVVCAMLCLPWFWHLSASPIRSTFFLTPQDIAGWRWQVRDGLQRIHLFLNTAKRGQK
jgi:O-antigen/teichoic acid export membrane protein